MFLFLILLFLGFGALSTFTYGKSFRNCPGTNCRDIYFTSTNSNDSPGSIDPGKDKDVGQTFCELVDSDVDGFYDTVLVSVYNTYPCYSSQVEAVIFNGGSKNVRISEVQVDADDELDFSITQLTGYIIHPQESVTTNLFLHVKESALESENYRFEVKICGEEAFGTGLGWWKNWKKHKTFSKERIENWLTQIDNESSWLGPTTVDGMADYLNFPPGVNAERKFLGHYLVLRLNVKASFLSLLQTHDVSAYDTGNYLMLSDPSAATLEEIILAIENKYNTRPTMTQFGIMKNICEAINELII